MKKYCRLLLLIASVSNAQLVTFHDHYFDCLSSSYNMNYAITLASPKGNLIKAKEFLNSDFFKNNPENTLLIQALLEYNTLGKNKAVALIAQSHLSQEQKDFANLWISFYAKNTSDYEMLLRDFRAKYPKNYQPFKLITRKHIDYRDKNMWNSIYNEKQRSLIVIDSLKNAKVLSEEDKVYFELLKLEFLRHKETSRSTGEKEEEYPDDKLASDLIAIWKEHSSLLDPLQLKSKIKRCSTEECREANDYVDAELSKSKASSSSDKVMRLLINQNNGEDSKPTVAQVEAKINELYTSEKNGFEQRKIQSLIALFSLEKAPDLGFLMKGMLEPVKFSVAFKAKFASNLNKQLFLADMDKTLQMPIIEDAQKNAEFVADFKKSLVNMQQLSTEDVVALNGLLLYSISVIKSVSQLKSSLYSFQNGPSYEVKSDMPAFVSFLEANPLYDNDSKYAFDFPELKSQAELMQFIQRANELTQKFPGSIGINGNILGTLAKNKKLAEGRMAEVYFAFLNFTIHNCSIDQSVAENSRSIDFDIFGRMLEKNEYDVHDNLMKLSSVLSEGQRQQLKDNLAKKIADNPHQQNLKNLKELFDKDF